MGAGGFGALTGGALTGGVLTGGGALMGRPPGNVKAASHVAFGVGVPGFGGMAKARAWGGMAGSTAGADANS